MTGVEAAIAIARVSPGRQTSEEVKKQTSPRRGEFDAVIREREVGHPFGFGLPTALTLEGLSIYNLLK